MCATEQTFTLSRLTVEILHTALRVEVGFLARNGRGIEEHP